MRGGCQQVDCPLPALTATATATATAEHIRTPSTGAARRAIVVEKPLNGTRNFRLGEAFQAKIHRARREASA
jgi:hypothetical protein